MSNNICTSDIRFEALTEGKAEGMFALERIKNK